jgi:hypothetical protein
LIFFTTLVSISSVRVQMGLRTCVHECFPASTRTLFGTIPSIMVNNFLCSHGRPNTGVLLRCGVTADDIFVLHIVPPRTSNSLDNPSIGVRPVPRDPRVLECVDDSHVTREASTAPMIHKPFYIAPSLPQPLACTNRTGTIVIPTQATHRCRRTTQV